jgi:hypothetical protein
MFELFDCNNIKYLIFNMVKKVKKEKKQHQEIEEEQ